ncbi:protoporphyrinogen oxidase [Natrarchaeobaculum aegyptiacum]|uniref:Protoporphyrinogen oxidase n=1 Tax=Natrarchaeobaculum aegyptiacum TaxID=745377 RepID=A0A2Z2HXJ4_9EURY|nr:protoporphyrinogen oxidase [Natrarchaeobaculum aegyptiacum]ARS90945.1 protoporphyrinogen oxidase [Natrarchaeobaculum aegyptiacum]
MTVGVVGAGISGLSLVRSLADRDVDVVAFDKRDSPGGIMRSKHVDDRVLELGPQRLRLTPGLESMIDDLDLGDRLRYGDDDQPIYVYHDGSLSVVPLSVREAITTDLLSPAAKLRILAEPLTGPPRADETVDAFLTRKFGKQAARRYLGPLYSGLYGTHPKNMLMPYSLGRALEKAGVERSVLLWVVRKLLSGRETPPICTFEGGLGELPSALYEAYDDQIHLETPVERIEPVDGGYALHTSAGIEYVDEVVLTPPAGVCADLLAPVDADLEATLRRFNYNPIGMVYLESDFDGTGIGTLVPPDSDVRISGLTWNASFLERDRLFTCYVDPNTDPEMQERSDDSLGKLAATEFERITGAPAEPIHVHRWNPGMPAYDRSWTAIDDLEPPAGIHFCTNFVDRPGIPGRIRAANRLARELTA